MKFLDHRSRRASTSHIRVVVLLVEMTVPVDFCYSDK